MQSVKLLLTIFLLSLMVACSTQTEKPSDEKLGFYNKTTHNTEWDHQIHPLLLQYYASLSSLKEQDTASLFLNTRSMVVSIDTLLNALSIDTLANKIYIESLQTLHDEYEALLMEEGWTSLHAQMNMIARDWVYVLGSIGYQKSPVYIFEHQGLCWISNDKIATNPYQKGAVKINASAVLQELPPTP